ncbi:TetR/AcrR family transcriptional regulator [Compostimonas suwonensis]|uniref:Regulatory TetR family protein n=1 Tax=Compostimonas suwonensis TaxID=1048394 RepID=A0A2M9BW57_9MICO|nr:TetR family transcriptional regulator [Compostimonas suwonensis]PJJ62192.1 regulatory TetR family protein [Compostimonas suwonensis]
MTRLPAAERRTRLVDAAVRVVAERGVAGATTRAIVAEAGMSLASFHYAFTSRDELMAELITTVVAHELTALRPELPTGRTLHDTLREGFMRYFDHLVAAPEREAAMLELTHYALRTPGLEALAERQYESYAELATLSLASAAAAHGVRWTRPVPELATTLVALTDGITIAWLVNRDGELAAAAFDLAAASIARFAEPVAEPVPSAHSSRPAHSLEATS